MRTRTIIVLVSLIACALVAKRAFGPPVSPGKLALIKSGMSEQDVQTILGPPTEVYQGGDVNKLDGTNYTIGPRWFYTRSFSLGCVMVVFNTNRLVWWTHDEVVDTR